MAAGHPEHVGIEKQKENKADGEQVHVEAEQNAGVKEIPVGMAHAAQGVDAANDGDDSGNDKLRGRVIGGEGREMISESEAGEDQHASAQYGGAMRIEDAGFHTDKHPVIKDRPGLPLRWPARTCEAHSALTG